MKRTVFVEAIEVVHFKGSGTASPYTLEQLQQMETPPDPEPEYDQVMVRFYDATLHGEGLLNRAPYQIMLTPEQAQGFVQGNEEDGPFYTLTIE